MASVSARPRAGGFVHRGRAITCGRAWCVRCMAGVCVHGCMLATQWLDRWCVLASLVQLPMCWRCVLTLSLSHAACADNHDPAQCAFSALVHWQWPGYGDSSGESGGVGGASATAGTSPEHDALPHPMADGNALFDTAFQVLKQRHKKGVLSAAGSKEPGMHRGSCAAVVKLQEARKHRNDPSDDA